MTSRERLIAALHQHPVDRVPYDPRIWHSHCPDSTFSKMSDLEKAAYLECDRVVKVPWDQDPHHIRSRNRQVEIVDCRSPREHSTIYRTSDGDLIAREAYSYGSWHPIEYPIKTEADLRRMRHVYDHSEYWVDVETTAELERIEAYYGETALAATGYVTTPLMELIQRGIGLEKTVWFLADCREDMDELLTLMHHDQLRKLSALLPHTSIEYIFAMENTSVDLVSPWMFRKYCQPHLTDYGNLIGSFGKHQILHMCGKIRQLLPDIEDIPAIALDSFSAPVVGNTTLRDGFEACPSKAIMGGTASSSWTKPEDEMVATILGDVKEAGKVEGLILQGPWEFWPGLSPEKIKRIWQAVRKGLAG